jgi:ArsR family transcriptional regulator
MRGESAMERFRKVIKALSDPSRVKIIKMLQIHPFCVCEIRDALGITRSTVSRNLKIIKNADPVVGSKEGLWVNYTLADSQGTPYAADMIKNPEHWLKNESKIQEFHRFLPAIDHHGIVGKR